MQDHVPAELLEAAAIPHVAFDDSGEELFDALAAQEHAAESVNHLVKRAPLDWSGASLGVYDDKGVHIVTVWFCDAGRGLAAAPETLGEAGQAIRRPVLESPEIDLDPDLGGGA